MKKVLAVALVATMFATAAFASPAINAKHAGKKTPDGTAVNCMYCHTTAKVEKKAGQDKTALQAGASCALAGCHAK